MRHPGKLRASVAPEVDAPWYVLRKGYSSHEYPVGLTSDDGQAFVPLAATFVAFDSFFR